MYFIVMVQKLYSYIGGGDRVGERGDREGGRERGKSIVKRVSEKDVFGNYWQIWIIRSLNFFIRIFNWFIVGMFMGR